jgi:hypothetical protein
MGPESSSPYSQQPVTCPSLEAQQSRTQDPILFLKSTFYNYPLIYTPKWSLSFNFSHQTLQAFVFLTSYLSKTLIISYVLHWHILNLRFVLTCASQLANFPWGLEPNACQMFLPCHPPSIIKANDIRRLWLSSFRISIFLKLQFTSILLPNILSAICFENRSATVLP